MNLAEVRDLLSTASGYDRWLRSSDPEEAGLMLTGWAELLEPVPYGVALEALRRHYSLPDARTIQPGDLVEAHRAAVREESVKRGQEVGRSEAWVRRCAFHTICACSHTECWGGFLDEETTVTNDLGREYPAVKRCPTCVDGIIMAEERGIARRPRPVAAGRGRR